jgi:NAD(P)-dependent dehydrogenase (short-subunit alcohol dehydrogenase family)
VPAQNSLWTRRSAPFGRKAADGLAVQADVSKEQDARRVVEAALEAYGRVDILINNAGISGGSLIHQHDLADWDRVLDVNLRGPFLMARAVLPSMRAQKSGHIVNISSESGLMYYEGDGSYGVSKHALNALGEYIQRENQGQNIRVNTVVPAWLSGMSENLPVRSQSACILRMSPTCDLAAARRNVKIGRRSQSRRWRTPGSEAGDTLLPAKNGGPDDPPDRNDMPGKWNVREASSNPERHPRSAPAGTESGWL